MTIRFNKFEKVAGAFVGLAIASTVLGMMAIAIENGWFARKVTFYTETESADGIHSGTAVQIAGLRVGQVTAVELRQDDKVLVEFEVFERFRPRVRQDSRVQAFRPFILADKVLEISGGSEGADAAPAGATLAMSANMDIMDLLSGKRMTQALSSFDKLADSLRIVGEAFADPERTQSIVQMVDRMSPLVKNLNTLTVDLLKITGAANKEKRIEVIVGSLAQVSRELEAALPAFSKEVPDVGVQLAQIVKNLNTLTTEFQKLTPAISAVAPELPRTSQRAVEALDETVVLLKAMQRSFFLRGKVDEVRQEENRRPANTSEP